MRTLRKRRFLWLICQILLLLCLLTTRIQASEDENSTEESWTDKAKATGSKLWGTVKEKAPAVKEKAGELWETGKEKAGEASENFKQWNQAQQDEFWERTEDQLNQAGGDEGAQANEEPPQVAEDANEPAETGGAAATEENANRQNDGADSGTDATEKSAADGAAASEADADKSASDGETKAKTSDEAKAKSSNEADEADEPAGAKSKSASAEQPKPSKARALAQVCVLVALGGVGAVGLMIMLKKLIEILL